MLKVDTPASGAATIAASTRPTGGIRKHKNVTCSCLSWTGKGTAQWQCISGGVSNSLKLWTGWWEKRLVLRNWLTSYLEMKILTCAHENEQMQTFLIIHSWQKEVIIIIIKYQQMNGCLLYSREKMQETESKNKPLLKRTDWPIFMGRE